MSLTLAECSYISCTPRYTDAAGSWLTNESLYAFSIWFNPSLDVSLEDLAQTIEADWRMLMRPRGYRYSIDILRFAICGQDYSREDLPTYRAADILRDKETFNAAWVIKTRLSPRAQTGQPVVESCTIL